MRLILAFLVITIIVDIIAHNCLKLGMMIHLVTVNLHPYD